MKNLDTAMKEQRITFAILEKYYFNKCRKGYNPLPELKEWLDDVEIPLSITYIETAVPIDIHQVIEWSVNKPLPLLVVHSLKIDNSVLTVKVFMLEGTWAIRPSKDYTVTIQNRCSHCKAGCEPVKLSEEKQYQADTLGKCSLTAIDQAIMEGMLICEECYNEKEN